MSKIPSRLQLVTCLVLPTLCLSTSFGSAKARPRPIFGGWAVYWDTGKSQRLSGDAADGLGEIDLFAYHFNDKGDLVPADSWIAEESVKKREKLSPSPRLLLTLVNDVVSPSGARLKDPGVIHDMLNSPVAQTKHLQQLVALSENFDGIEIDYENLLFRDKELFSHFIDQAARALHDRGKFLSVVVQPKITDSEKDGAGAFDWAALAGSADIIKIMAYYFHYGKGAPGPVAPSDWLARIVSYAQPLVPADKLCITLTLYGIDWPKNAPGKLVEFAQVKELAENFQGQWGRDKVSQSPVLSYERKGVIHTVWFEDAISLEEKIKMLSDAGVQRINFWRLGTGEPEFWLRLKRAR